MRTVYDVALQQHITRPIWRH